MILLRTGDPHIPPHTEDPQLSPRAPCNPIPPLRGDVTPLGTRDRNWGEVTHHRDTVAHDAFPTVAATPLSLGAPLGAGGGTRGSGVATQPCPRAWRCPGVTSPLSLPLLRCEGSRGLRAADKSCPRAALPPGTGGKQGMPLPGKQRSRHNFSSRKRSVLGRTI